MDRRPHQWPSHSTRANSKGHTTKTNYGTRHTIRGILCPQSTYIIYTIDGLNTINIVQVFLDKLIRCNDQIIEMRAFPEH
jgi:hypothetical protein